MRIDRYGGKSGREGGGWWGGGGGEGGGGGGSVGGEKVGGGTEGLAPPDLCQAEISVQVSFSAKQASAAGQSISMSNKEWARTLFQLLLLVATVQLLLLGLDLLLPPGQVC